MEFTLHCGNTTARVRQKGAQMTSFKGNDNREVIWQADPAVWGNHAPVLFPICGTAKDNHVIIDGVSYPIAKHGFSRNPEFTVEKIGDDFIELVLTPTEESKPSYPFEFAFHVVYTLRENGFSAQFIVENKSDKVMPFCCGGHPGFIVPMEAGASYTDYELVFPQVEDGRNSLCPGGYLRRQRISPLLPQQPRAAAQPRPFRRPRRADFHRIEEPLGRFGQPQQRQRTALLLPEDGGAGGLVDAKEECGLRLLGAVARDARSGDGERPLRGQAVRDAASARAQLAGRI